MSKVTIGCDPELFAYDQNGNPVSVHNILLGNKKYPAKVPHGAVQVDGTSAEFNIDPVETVEDFIHHVRSVSSFMEMIIKQSNPMLSLRATPVAHFDKMYFASLPKEATMLGCDPDYNAWTFEANPKPKEDVTFRTGSGHIHIGNMNPRADGSKETVVRLLDTTVGFAQSIWDKDTTRQELYGKPGAYRVKRYGVEWRSLSNAWMNSEAAMRFIFANAKAIGSDTNECTRSSNWKDVTDEYRCNLYKRYFYQYCLSISKLGLATPYDFFTKGEIKSAFPDAEI